MAERISAPIFAARNDQMICCSQRNLIGLPLTRMRFGGTSSPVAAVIAPPRCRPASSRTTRSSSRLPVSVNRLIYRAGSRTPGRSWADGGAKLGPGGDPEFGEHPVQVRADGAMGQVELLADPAG